MARSFGRLFASIWNDEDYRPLSVGAKFMYGFFISQDDLEHSGIIPFRPARWAKLAGEPVEDVMAWVKELDEQRYVITDDEVGELLVRSLIRRDDIWKQPNVFKAAATSAKNSQSPQIKATLYHEIRRLTMVGTGRETRVLRDELLSHLEPFANPSPIPPEGFPRGSGNHDGGDTGTPGEPSQGGSREGGREAVSPASVDNPARSGNGAGGNPSGTPGEPLANGSAGVRGKGSSYGPVPVVPLPLSPSPSPVVPAEASRPLWPAAVPDDEDSFQDVPPDISALVAEVREIRPDWSTRSIRRVLNDPAVRERPWPRVRRAALAVARDPASKQPGRLSHDGPWWNLGDGEDADVERLPWCGHCSDDVKRQVENADGTVRRCPNCHPLREAS